MKKLHINVMSNISYEDIATKIMNDIKNELVTYSNISFVSRTTDNYLIDLYNITGYTNLLLSIYYYNGEVRFRIVNISEPTAEIRGVSGSGFNLHYETIYPVGAEPYNQYYGEGTLFLFSTNNILFGLAEAYNTIPPGIISFHLTNKSKYMCADTASVEDNSACTVREIEHTIFEPEDEHTVIISNALIGGYDALDTMFLLRNERYRYNMLFDLVSVNGQLYRQTGSYYMFIKNGDEEVL